jgi:hypothetical protein
MLALTIILFIVGSFALLSFGLAARRALRRNPCPSCARSSLRWSGTRLVRAPNGSTVDVVDRGHCHACTATIFQSHQNGWWRATTTGDFPPSLAFTIPLAWRDSLQHWRWLDQARTPITRLSGSPRSVSIAVGAGLIAGFACLTVAGALIKSPKVTTSTVRLDDIPPSVFQSTAADHNPITPVDSTAWDELGESLDAPIPMEGTLPSAKRVIAPLGVQVRLSGEWKEVANEKIPFGTLVGFQRDDGGAPTILTIAVVRPPGTMGDENLTRMLRGAISEAQAATGVPPQEITCQPDPRGQLCGSSIFSYRILGWSWMENGRAYLVLALLPMAEKNLGSRMTEVYQVVDSIKPVI